MQWKLEVQNSAYGCYAIQRGRNGGDYDMLTSLYMLKMFLEGYIWNCSSPDCQREGEVGAGVERGFSLCSPFGFLT